MKTAGIAIDDWKLEIFKRHLGEAGYGYEQRPLPGNCLLLRVTTENIEALQAVVQAANLEATRTGKPQ